MIDWWETREWWSWSIKIGYAFFSIMNWKQLGYELFMRNSEGNIMGIYFMRILWEYYGSTIHEIWDNSWEIIIFPYLWILNMDNIHRFMEYSIPSHGIINVLSFHRFACVGHWRLHGWFTDAALRADEASIASWEPWEPETGNAQKWTKT